MTQDKMRKVITACVSAATVLLVLLLSFLVYQWIRIAVLNQKIEKAEAEVAYWQEQVDKGGEDLEFYQSKFYLDWALQKLEALEGKK